MKNSSVKANFKLTSRTTMYHLVDDNIEHKKTKGVNGNAVATIIHNFVEKEMFETFDEEDSK